MVFDFSFLQYRKIADRPRDPAKWDEIADVVAALSIPVIANGDVLEYDDFSRIKTATGTHENHEISKYLPTIVCHVLMIILYFNVVFLVPVKALRQ